jgi:hypothetical protein
MSLINATPFTNDAGDLSNSGYARAQEAARNAGSWLSSTSAALGSTATNAVGVASTTVIQLSILSVVLFCVAIACAIGVVVLVTAQGGRNNRAGFVAPGGNCSVITCPQGPIGLTGGSGPAGLVFLF